LLTNEKQYDDDVTIAALKQEISRLKLKKKKIEPERRAEKLWDDDKMVLILTTNRHIDRRICKYLRDRDCKGIQVCFK